jgi:hypothetical protein
MYVLPLAPPASYLIYQSNGEMKFWHGHPLFMTLAYISLCGNAITLKKLGGVENTAYHGYLMMAVSVMSLAGSTIIYVNKENLKKEHLQTTHSLIGGTVMTSILYPIVSWVLYNPYNGWKSKPMGNIWRTLHRYTAYFIITGSFLAMATGIAQVTAKDPIAQYGFLGTLAIIYGGFIFSSFLLGQ